MVTDKGITLTNKQLRNIARKFLAKHPDLKGVVGEHIRTVVVLIDEQRRINELRDTDG